MQKNECFSTKKNFYGVLLEETDSWKNMTNFMEETLMQARENGEKVWNSHSHIA